ncbi:MAG: 50S ribosomal protein L32 [Candidatus Yonathbacteria bacterium]|nr:50S ribosomal protein L32 [Candidatus Yonathbacteria bacterium]
MVVRMRHTRAHTANRRSHHALVGARLSKCVKCSASHIRHQVCSACGTYRGKEVVSLVKALTKTTKRKESKNNTISK